MDGCDAAPSIVVPERLDRPLRLGPFASGRDVIKFVCGAAVGAVVGLLASPAAGLAIGLGAAALVLWRPGGEPLDARLQAVGGFALRRLLGAGPVSAAAGGPAARGAASYLRLADGRPVAVLRAAAVPLAYLPPGDLAAQFDRFRAMLRTVDPGLVVVAASSPIHAAAVLPATASPDSVERTAFDGYRELVTLLARRRTVRKVLVGVLGTGSGGEALRRLETSTASVQEHLSGLGVVAERLRGAALRDAGRSVGLPVSGGPP